MPFFFSLSIYSPRDLLLHIYGWVFQVHLKNMQHMPKECAFATTYLVEGHNNERTVCQTKKNQQCYWAIEQIKRMTLNICLRAGNAVIKGPDSLKDPIICILSYKSQSRVCIKQDGQVQYKDLYNFLWRLIKNQFMSNYVKCSDKSNKATSMHMTKY